MRTRAAISVALILMTTATFAQLPQSRHFALQELTDGVYAAVASDSGFAICNAGIVDLGDGLLVFDPFISPRAAADLRQAAHTVLQKPVLYIVNSHSHNDHIRGNQAFTGARIITTVLTRQAIAQNEPEEIAWEKANAVGRLQEMRKIVASEADSARRAEAMFWVIYFEALIDSHDSLRTVLPDLTFEGRLVIHGSQRSVELIETGPGHTESDLILYLPGEGIVFAGDLLFVGRHPYLADGNPGGWLHALERIERLHAPLLVPGHGPVADTLSLGALKRYIIGVGNMAAELVRRRASEQDIAAQPILPEFRTWVFSRFFQSNLQFMVKLETEQAK